MPGDESTGDEFLAEFLDDYFAESDEHLTAVRRILLELESESGVAGISPAMLSRAAGMDHEAATKPATRSPRA